MADYSDATKMTNYSVSIKECSKELTKRERIRIKDTSNAVKLDEATNGDSPLVIEPDYYAVLAVHNEKSENKDYEVYIIVDTSGTKFVTGSTSFITSFIDIWGEMKDDDSDEPWQIEVYKKDSKNYKGKQFLTCSIV